MYAKTALEYAKNINYITLCFSNNYDFKVSSSYFDDVLKCICSAIPHGDYILINYT